MTKKDPNNVFKSSCSDSNYVTKAMNEFTLMTNEELQNWEKIQKAVKMGILEICW